MQDGHESFFSRRIWRPSNGRSGQELRTRPDVNRGCLQGVFGTHAVSGTVDRTVATRWTRTKHTRRARWLSPDTRSPRSSGGGSLSGHGRPGCAYGVCLRGRLGADVPLDRWLRDTSCLASDARRHRQYAGFDHAWRPDRSIDTTCSTTGRRRQAADGSRLDGLLARPLSVSARRQGRIKPSC
jgi:hypothetical protein